MKLALGISIANAPAPSGPRISAGPDQVVNFSLTDTATLVAHVYGITGEYTVLWEQISGAGTIVFGDATSLATTATADEIDVYEIRVTLSRDGFDDLTDSLLLTFDAFPGIRIHAPQYSREYA